MSSNAYAEACNIEDLGASIVFEFLEQVLGKVIRVTGKDRQVFGDYYVEKAGKDHAIEVKHEIENIHKNLFLETWSNRHLKQGWLYTSRADILIYHFIKNREIYMISMDTLRKWAYEPGHLDVYEEKEQVKYEQINTTCGRPVPIDVLIEKAGMRKYIVDEGGNWKRELF